MENLKIKNLVIEFRKRIQSGNCFISFNNTLDKHQTRVSLKSSEFIIQIDDDVHKVDTKDFFEINIKSFHSLLVKDSFISFRFITSNQFDTELLKVGDTTNKFQRIKLSVDSNGSEVDVAIKCSNCESSLTTAKDVKVRRILELPSSNLDISEWFCHRHSDEKLFDDAENKCESPSCFNEKTQQFQPKLHDILHGPFCLLMNSQLFDKNRMIEKRNQLYCKRCLQSIGESNVNFIRFWWETVKFNNRLFFDVASTIDLVKLVIRNHLSCDGMTFLTPIVKIIFEATIPNDDKKVHVLIQVMDRNLQLLKLNLDDFQLVEQSTIKVMFLKLTHSNEDDAKTLKYWQKDVNVTNYELSCKMFHTLCEYLIAQSELIPDIYRTNNSFQFSYIQCL